ncbi:hypothetical protein GCM10023187_05640 [Nibrella viscosa]|uniref:Histidine kinase domain-containing protein n=1 Tax=Nibrella viscosa TaxID=1084524 RepID=A0ABP8JWS8_9BACT
MTDNLNDNKKNSQDIPFRFQRLYISTLVVLAILLTIGQVLTQWRIGGAQDELWIIRYSSLQRHQSQQIVNKALQLTDPAKKDEYKANLSELRSIFVLFERCHLEGREGKIQDRNIYVPNSDTVQRLYELIRPNFEAFQSSTRALLKRTEPNEGSSPEALRHVEILLANEKPFLQEMDGIVQQYTHELRNKLENLQHFEFYIFMLTMMVLAGIGAFIFRPAVQQLYQTLQQLIEAETNTAAANRKLLSLNKSLKDTRQKLFEATKQQYQQQIDEQKSRTSYLIAGQEEERKRLSRELHDGLGQMLTAIKLQVEGLEASLHSQSIPVNNINTLKNLITQTIQEARHISNNLMPSVLSDFGIVPALKMLADTHDANPAIEVAFCTNFSTVRLEKNLEIMLYRVTQEALSNAVRHAKPTRIVIELFAKDNYLHLIISDNGHGFRPQRLRQPHGQGIHNMNERVKILDGKFKIVSVPGKGTKVQVSLPNHSPQSHHEYDQADARR